MRQASDAFWATVWRAAFIDRISRSLQNCNDWQDKIFTVTEDRLSVRSSAQTSCLSPDALAPPNLKISARKFFVRRDNQDNCLLVLTRSIDLAKWSRSSRSPAPSNRQSIKRRPGGEIVGVRREDDTNGKWTYEVVVRTNGKEWGFEVDPNGKLLRTHGEIK